MATTEDPRTESEQPTATEEWREERYDAKPEREGELFSTISGVENEPLYTPDNVELDYERDLGCPGAYPFTRGVYPSMYRGRLWTMRQFAGFGTAAGDERALPLPARARADGALDGVRHADADGLRLATTRARSARSAARASRSTRSTTWRRSSPGSRSARSRPR